MANHANSKQISIEAAVALIQDDMTITVSSSSGLGCPDAILKAIGQRFTETGSPRQLTTIHPIAAGDMYGIDGIDHIAQKGLLKRAIAGSYPSGPSSRESPKIWQMIYNNEIEAYNIPSGILFHIHRESAGKRPGVLTKVGMETYVDPRLLGAKMNDVTQEDLVKLVEFDGDEWLYFPSIPIDVALIRGTTADEQGNISTEHEGAYLGAYDQALAAHNNGGIVIAQVKRVAANGTIPTQAVRVPSVLVDYVVVVPDQMQTTQTQHDPAISGEVRVPSHTFDGVEWGPDKVIARRAAQELQRGEAVNLGFGISALVPRICLEEGEDDAISWVIEQGAVGGVPLLGFQFGCSANAQALVPSPDQFNYFQGGGFDRTMLSFMQISKEGDVNVSRLNARPHVTAGVGGFIDITAHAKRIVFSGYFTAGGLRLNIANGRLHIEKEGKVNKFVNEVEHVTFSGKRARQQGQEVTIVTERCVMKLLDDGLTVTEVAPGVDLETQVLARADFELKVSSELKEMEGRLFQPEPLGNLLD